MEKKKEWSDYYAKTAGNPPTPLLVKSLAYIKNIGNSLELGAGSPKDSIFLLEKGFKVTAIDSSDSSKELFAGLEGNPDFIFEQNTFEGFEFKKETYDLISAQRALPFIKQKADMVKVFENIKYSLKTGGVFVGTLFGPNDTWCKEGKPMTFLEKSEVQELLKGLKIEALTEKENDSETAKGTPHHWHIFYIIAVKE